MEIGEIGIALTAKKLDFTKDLRFITILSKTAIAILDIAGSYDYTVSHFKKIGVIAALRAGDS